MYFVTLAAAAVIGNRPQVVVGYAVVGVILGWVVAGKGLHLLSLKPLLLLCDFV